MAEDFLSRWSRRKLAEKEPEPAVPEIVPDEELPEAATDEDAIAGEAVAGEDEAAAPDAERERHPAEDIDIESLTKESDFTIFMQKGVPKALKRQALRKLWVSDPVLANLDGLNDYEDMERVYGISSVVKTDWKLGRGFLSDVDLGIAPEEGTEPDAGTEPETPVADGEPDAPDAAETVDEAEVVAEAESDPGEGTTERDDTVDSRKA